MNDVCRQSLAKKQEELRGYEMQISNATKGVDMDSSLASVQSKLQTHQEYVLPRHLAFLSYRISVCRSYVALFSKCTF